VSPRLIFFNRKLQFKIRWMILGKYKTLATSITGGLIYLLYFFIFERVTWAPFKSGELLSSVKLDCFNIRFSVARSARNKFYRGRSAQFLTWWFRHHGETSGGDAGCCVITATATSGVGHVWACSILGEEPVLTHCWHRHRLLPQKLVLLLYMDWFFLWWSSKPVSGVA
jgi:hypothetical protein